MLVALDAAGVCWALFGHTRSYESVPDLAAALLLRDVECELGFVPAVTHGSIMRTPVNYEDGECRMPRGERVSIRVYGTDDQYDLWREEMLGHPRGVTIVIGPNWEVQAPGRAIAVAFQAAIGGRLL
jgi:hypothetical protein